jgi:hypothetical protein
MRRFAVATLLLLVACGTPQEQCIRRETQDLRTLDRLIAETEQNISRGYAIEEYQTWEWETYTCYRPGPDGQPEAGTCQRRVPDIDTRPVSINVDDERAKLRSMQTKRIELARRAAAAAEACRRAYPE